MDKERRTFSTVLTIEKREDGQPGAIIGYGALFNSLSEDLGGFREQIAPGFFDSMLQDDVRGLFNHNENQILGRTTAGTMKLTADEKGLKYTISPLGNRSYEKDLIESLQRGEINQSSFAFSVEEDSWDEVNGEVIRTLIKGQRLYDVSPVTFPAYPDTTSAKRELRKFLDEKTEEIEDNELIEYELPDGNKVFYRFSTPCKKPITISYVEEKQLDLFEDEWNFERENRLLELEFLY